MFYSRIVICINRHTYQRSSGPRTQQEYHLENIPRFLKPTQAWREGSQNNKNTAINPPQRGSSKLEWKKKVSSKNRMLLAEVARWCGNVGPDEPSGVRSRVPIFRPLQKKNRWSRSWDIWTRGWTIFISTTARPILFKCSLDTINLGAILVMLVIVDAEFLLMVKFRGSLGKSSGQDLVSIGLFSRQTWRMTSSPGVSNVHLDMEKHREGL